MLSLSLEALAMVLFAAVAVWLAFTKCPCTATVDDGYDAAEAPTR